MRVGTRWVAAALGLVALVATGCGSDGGDPAGVASLNGNSRNASSTETTAKKLDPADAARAFARCMRDHGVDMPDPKIGTNGEVQIQVGGPGVAENVDPKKMEGADRACRHFMEDAQPNGGKRLDPKQEAEARKRALDFAKCMREHGVDMPDPQFNGGRVTQQFRNKGNVSDRKLQAAQQACAKDLPKGGKGGFTVTPGGGASSANKDT